MSAALDSIGATLGEWDPVLAQLLAQRRAERRVSPENAAARVTALLEAEMRQPPPRALQLVEVAERLHVSARTLKRYLHAAGLSYRPLLDRVRLSRAVEMLRCTSLPVEEIAVCVGYSSAANLARALRRWGGVKPGELRRVGVSRVGDKQGVDRVTVRPEPVEGWAVTWQPLAGKSARTSTGSARTDFYRAVTNPSGPGHSPGLSSRDKLAADEDRDAAQSPED